MSLVFVKKLFAVAISNIAHTRKLFPDLAFFDKNVEGQSVKILKEDISCPGSCKVVFWLRGCFDAIEKRYLRKATLALYEDINKPQDITESFSFGFRYKGSNASMDMSNDSPSLIDFPDEFVSSSETEEVKSQTKNLLNGILSAGKILNPLPKSLMLTMKLQYYDVAPIDYAPNGFKLDNSPEFEFASGPVNIKVGSVETGFHGIRMLVHTNKYLYNAPKDAEKNSLPSISSSENSKSKHNISLSNPNIVQTPRASLPQTMNDLAETANEDVFEVHCPCGVDTDCGIMILCDGCERWQHAVCFRIIDNEEVPKSHLCNICAKTNQKMLDSGSVTDTTLLNLSEEKLKSTCLFRRALLICLDSDVISVGSLSKFLSICSTSAKGIMTKLQEEGAIKDTRARSGNKAVLKAHVEGVLIPRYFYAKNQPCKKQQLLEDGTLSNEVHITSPGSGRNNKELAHKHGRNHEIGDLSAQTENLKLKNDHEIQIVSQESNQSPIPQKRRKSCNVVNTPMCIKIK